MARVRILKKITPEQFAQVKKYLATTKPTFTRSDAPSKVNPNSIHVTVTIGVALRGRGKEEMAPLLATYLSCVAQYMQSSGLSGSSKFSHKPFSVKSDGSTVSFIMGRVFGKSTHKGGVGRIGDPKKNAARWVKTLRGEFAQAKKQAIADLSEMATGKQAAANKAASSELNAKARKIKSALAKMGIDATVVKSGGKVTIEVAFAETTNT